MKELLKNYNWHTHECSRKHYTHKKKRRGCYTKYTIQLLRKLVGVGNICSPKLTFSIKRQENEIKNIPKFTEKNTKILNMKKICKGPIQDF